jgi:Type III flagellar switch regulator (C-ring) FliN C-term
VSAVLRKKIDSGAGVPPSILQMQEFWAQLLSRTDDWAMDTFDLESKPILSSRRVVSGRAAAEMAGNPFTLFFASDLSPGLCAIAFDAACAVRCAANRLRQDPSSLEDASPLFLKLLSEQPTVALWQQLANGLTGHDVLAREDPQSEAAATAGGLAATCRYLQVELTLTLDGQASLVTCLFHVDYLLTYARNDVRLTADRKAKACSQSPKSLSDSVKASAISLDAVLDRMTLTIGECSRLEIGDVLPLAGADAGRLSLCAETIHGSVDIGTGELGVWKRKRAVKLHTPVSESFARAIR